MKGQPDRAIVDLSIEEMRFVIGHIQGILWFDMNGPTEFWNTEKPWSPDTLDDIAHVLVDFGLKPKEE